MSDTDSAVKDSVATDATPTAPAAAETTSTEENLDTFDLDAADFQDSSDDDTEGDSDDAAADTDADDTDTDETEADATDDDQEADTESDDGKEKSDRTDKRKEALNTEIRDLVTQRNQLRQQIAEANSQVYEARTADQLQQEVNPDTGEYYTALEARLQSMEESQALRDYNDQVAESQLVLSSEAQRVLQDFPMFNPENKEYKEIEPLMEAANEVFAPNIIRDPNTVQKDENGNPIPGTGQMVGTHLSSYKLYKLLDDAYKLGASKGEQNGQASYKKMLASADDTGSAGPKTPKKDAFAAAFDKEFDKF